MKQKDGGPAFPESHPKHPCPSGGMSLQDYFAGQALVGMLASQHVAVWDNPDKAAAWAYEYADAMLAAREGS